MYTALAANRSLDVAVTEGQQALYLAPRGGDDAGAPLEWATPALFSRGVGAWRLGVDARQAAAPAVRLRALALGELATTGSEFVGRQREQRQIRRALHDGAVRAVLIHGFGGIGKTALAARVAQRLVDHDAANGERFDGVFGRRARADLTADELLRDLNAFLQQRGVDAFDPVLRSPLPLSQKIEALVELLRQMRLLLIFDNCEDWLEHVDGGHRLANPDLALLLAALVSKLDQGSRLLLTSRYSFDLLPPGRLAGAVLRLPLGELNPTETLRLLATLPGLAATDEATRRRVAQAVGGHPFVLNLFARRAERDGVEHVLADVASVKAEAEEVGKLLLRQIVDDLHADARRLLTRAAALRRPAPRSAWKPWPARTASARPWRSCWAGACWPRPGWKTSCARSQSCATPCTAWCGRK